MLCCKASYWLYSAGVVMHVSFFFDTLQYDMNCSREDEHFN